MHPSFDSRENIPGSAHAILESITDAFYSLNSSWEFTYLNRQAAKLLAQRPEDLLGKNFWQVYPALIGTDFEKLYQRVVRDRVAGSVTSFYPDHDRWYEAHVYPAENGISIYFRDVTERARSEERLRQSELRFRRMADSIPQIVWIVDASGRGTFFNKQWCDYTGVAISSEMPEQVTAEYIHPDDQDATMQAWEAAWREDCAFSVEHRIRSAAGEYRWFLVRAEPQRDPETGKIASWFGTSTDVHDQKLAAAALKKSEERYRSLFESIDEGFCIVELLYDENGKACDYRFCEVNPMFEKQSGLKNVCGKRARELVPQHEQRWFDTFGTVATTGEPVRFEDETKALNRWFDVYAFRIEDGEAPRVAILFKDITGRRRIEQELADKVQHLQEAERRQAFQLELADAIRPLAHADEVTTVASELLGRYLGAGRVGYFEVDDADNSLRVKRDWTGGTLASLAGRRLHLENFGPEAAAMLRAGQCLVVADVVADPRVAPYARNYLDVEARAMVAVPVMKAGGLRAVLKIHQPAPRAWSDQDVQLAEDAVERMWAAVERAHAEEKRQLAEESLQKSADRHAFRLQIADQLRSLSHVDDIFSRTSELLGRFFSASRVLFGHYDLDRKTVDFHSGYTDGTVASLEGMYSVDGFGARNFASLEEGATWVSHDLEHDPRTAGPDTWPTFAALQIRSGLVVPLSRQGKLMACLFVNDKHVREWKRQEVALIEDIADRVWNAVERVRSQQEQQQAEDKLVEASRRKDEFLAMLAHELRNPLAPVSAAAELLRLARLGEEGVRRTSEIISRQVGHMTSLIDDLLDVSRVTRGLITLDRRRMDMRRIVAEAVEQVSPLIEARHHQLQLQLSADDVCVMGDHKRLVQVMANLLNNAAKYTPEGGSIALCTGLREEQVELSVTDNGIGIEPELAGRVFELFAQAQRSSDRSSGGLGLGLALVKSLVELHGGSVACFSEGVGRGSRFTVCLPHLPEEVSAGQRDDDARQVRTPGKALRILVVDDNADAAQMLAMFLHEEGHEVRVEHDSLRAFDRARMDGPDVCLLDIGLAPIDGNELARRLRVQPETARAFLIAVTGYGQQHDREAAAAAGFSHYFVKPVDTGKLAALLATISAA